MWVCVDKKGYTVCWPEELVRECLERRQKLREEGVEIECLVDNL